VVEGITTSTVSTLDEIMKVLSVAERHRTKGLTLLNSESSRAHTVFQIDIRDQAKCSTITLVDLAGSEKEEQGEQEERLLEGMNINKSLSCLAEVVKAISDEQSGLGTEIPYANSTLTKLLRNALGGNCKTYMLCTIVPGARFFNETIQTLNQAQMASRIQNSPQVNQLPSHE
jgi:hypothetical protein